MADSSNHPLVELTRLVDQFIQLEANAASRSSRRKTPLENAQPTLEELRTRILSHCEEAGDYVGAGDMQLLQVCRDCVSGNDAEAKSGRKRWIATSRKMKTLAKKAQDEWDRPVSNEKIPNTIGWLISQLEQSEQASKANAKSANNATSQWSLPDPTAMPGIDRIAYYCRKQFDGSGLTVANLYKLRDQICEKLKWQPEHIRCVDGLSFVEAAGALEGRTSIPFAEIRLLPGIGVPGPVPITPPPAKVSIQPVIAVPPDLLQKVRNWLYARFVENQKKHTLVRRYSLDGSPQREPTEDEKTFAPVPLREFHDFLHSMGGDMQAIISNCEHLGWIRYAEGGFDVKNLQRFYHILPAITNPWPETPFVDDETQTVPKGAGTAPNGKATSNARRKLPPSREKAYHHYEWAVTENSALDGATDRAVYDWLKENLKEDLDDLPNADTFSSYLKEARKFYGTQKHLPSSGKANGKTVVKQNQL